MVNKAEEPERAEPRKDVTSKLTPYARRAAAVASGGDTYSSGDIQQQILALLVRFVDPGAAG